MLQIGFPLLPEETRGLHYDNHPNSILLPEGATYNPHHRDFSMQNIIVSADDLTVLSGIVSTWTTNPFFRWPIFALTSEQYRFSGSYHDNDMNGAARLVKRRRQCGCLNTEHGLVGNVAIISIGRCLRIIFLARSACLTPVSFTCSIHAFYV